MRARVCLCGFGEQLAGEVVQIFVDFLQSLNFLFELRHSDLRVLSVPEHRLKHTDGWKRVVSGCEDTEGRTFTELCDLQARDAPPSSGRPPMGKQRA